MIFWAKSPMWSKRRGVRLPDPPGEGLLIDMALRGKIVASNGPLRADA
jgi:hypothetical protein